MTTNGIVWQSSPGDMADRAKAYGERLIRAVFALATEWAARIADDARQNAPWTDRTGLARRTLTGRAFRTATGAVIAVSGGAPYQIFLERKYGGRWAAIAPALQRAYAQVMANLQQLVR